jgi:hypothetical protein
MEYNKLVAVTAMPGLFELISSRKDGAVVRSLDDSKTQFISNRVHNFTQLESIEIFTVQENVNLIELFNAMDKAGGSLPDAKDSAAVKKYFEKVYPDMDFERVYPSDMKKMVKWFEALKHHNIDIKLSEPVEEEPTEEIEEETKQEKPKKTTPRGAKKKDTPAEKKPAKKGKTKKK